MLQRANNAARPTSLSYQLVHATQRLLSGWHASGSFNTGNN
jgi:hypothetical protein